MGDNNDMLLRLNELIKKTGLNQTQFAREADMRQNNLSEILSGKRVIGSNVINKLVISFGINKDWLITGEGEMFERREEREIKYLDNELLAKSMKVIPKKKKESMSKLDTRPRIPYTASAGSLTSAVEGVTTDQCEQIPVITAFPRYDYTMIVKGDSMYPNYEGGDEVACKRIDDTSFIQWGKVHVLDTAQGIVIKRIYDDVGNIRCVSYNKEYPDFTVSKEEVYSISLVVGMLRL